MALIVRSIYHIYKLQKNQFSPLFYTENIKWKEYNNQINSCFLCQKKKKEKKK
jgi:hypothetical protein